MADGRSGHRLASCGGCLVCRGRGGGTDDGVRLFWGCVAESTIRAGCECCVKWHGVETLWGVVLACMLIGDVHFVSVMVCRSCSLKVLFLEEDKTRWSLWCLPVAICMRPGYPAEDGRIDSNTPLEPESFTVCVRVQAIERGREMWEAVFAEE